MASGRSFGRDTTTGRFRGTTKDLDESARALRQRMTPAEQALWRALRGHRLAGLGFRRQHPVGSFVLDFACASRLLAVEVDGSVHADQLDYDTARTDLLSAYGWQVIRFPNERVLSDLPAVLDEIRRAAVARPLAPGQRTYVRTER